MVITDEAENVIVDVIQNFDKHAQTKIVHAGKVKDLDALPTPRAI